MSAQEKFKEWEDIIEEINKSKKSLLKTCAVRFFYGEVAQTFSYLTRNPHGLSQEILRQNLSKVEKYLAIAEEIKNKDLSDNLYNEN